MFQFSLFSLVSPVKRFFDGLDSFTPMTIIAVNSFPFAGKRLHLRQHASYSLDSTKSSKRLYEIHVFQSVM